MTVWIAALLLAAAIAGIVYLDRSPRLKPRKYLRIAGIICLGIAALGLLWYLTLTALLVVSIV